MLFLARKILRKNTFVQVHAVIFQIKRTPKMLRSGLVNFTLPGLGAVARAAAIARYLFPKEIC